MPIITISRQPGSWGPQIAQELCDQLGLELIRRSHLHQMAQECNEEYKNACRLYEKEEFSGFFERLMMDKSTYRILFEALHYELASKGGVVILGRGGHIVLKDIPGVVRIRLIAEQDVRVKRIMAKKGIRQDEADSFIHQFSMRHRAMIKAIFNQDVDKPIDYDLVLNTTSLTVQQAADAIVHFVRIKQSERQTEVDKDMLGQMAFVKRLETLVRKQVYILPYRNFKISVQGPGRISLSGIVEHQNDIQRIGDIIAEAEGVECVDNKLRAFGALPSSQGH